MTRSRPRAFTLIEVIVALAIAGGALVLLIAASQAALHRSLNARKLSRVSRAAESKLEECVEGAEHAFAGDCADLPGWIWRLRLEKEETQELDGLKVITLAVYSPEAPFKPYRTYSRLVYQRLEPKP